MHIRPHRPVALPLHLHRPGRCHVLAVATHHRTEGNPIDHHFRQTDVQTLQLLGYELPLRFTEAPPYLTLKVNVN